MKILKKQKAFTLIELIVVVSIVVILMSIVIPGAQKVLANARKAKAQACMKQIAEAYCRYYQAHGYLPTGSSALTVIEEFAKEGELNNANLFVFPGDAQAAKVLREQIWPKDEDGKFPWESGKRLSVTLVRSTSAMKELNPSTTPVVFSRGLMPGDGSDGKWGFSGVWHDEGGFIGFLDGQVRWYKDLNGDDEDGVLSSDNASTNNVSNFLSGLGLNYCHESSYSS